MAYMISANMDQGAIDFQLEAAISKVYASVSIASNVLSAIQYSWSSIIQTPRSLFQIVNPYENRDLSVKVRALSLFLWCRGEDKGLPEIQLVLLTAVAGWWIHLPFLILGSSVVCCRRVYSDSWWNGIHEGKKHNLVASHHMLQGVGKIIFCAWRRIWTLSSLYGCFVFGCWFLTVVLYWTLFLLLFWCLRTVELKE